MASPEPQMPMPAKATYRPVVLCILDGWGHRVEIDGNAIALAETPHWDRLMATCPHALIDASATDVGLPAGQMGNSEVGHMNIGAGRVVLQDLPRIDAAVREQRLGETAAITRLIEALRASGGACHLLGLVSPGGVHAHQDHIVALAQTLAAANIPVRIHALLDGRDTPPRSAHGYLQQLEAALADLGDVAVVTVCGRYYAMDRDKRWQRVSRAYAALVDADGHRRPSAIAAIDASYAANVSDEFVEPAVIGAYQGMADGDGLLMANFRADRAREILTALVDPAFDAFARGRRIRFAASLGMVEYSTALNDFLETVFPPVDVDKTLGEVVAAAGLRQLRVAETEKYAHVTFFLNGGREAPFANETRKLVPSPKVATYDLQPEMSAPAVCDTVVDAIVADDTDLIVVNFANTDMVGHTGILPAATRAVAAVDQCLGRIAEAIESTGGALLITADHGNAEQMFNHGGGQAHTAHTTNKVPLVIVGTNVDAVRNGRLADLAPTVLALLGIAKPGEMTGASLIGDVLPQDREQTSEHAIA